MRIRSLLAATITALALVLGATPASAHPTGTTLLTIDRAPESIGLLALIPLDRLEAVAGFELTDRPEERVAQHEPELREMLLASVLLLGTDGTPFAVTVEHLSVKALDGVDQLSARMRARPPTASRLLAFTIRYRAVVQHDDAHRVFVAVDGGGDEPELIGTITSRHTDLVVTWDRLPSIAFAQMVLLGFSHFRAGIDHVMFLMLVTAGAVFSGNSGRARLAALLLRTAMFTAGHSISLALAASRTLRPPSRFVETAIALTVLLGAISLTRPRISPRVETALTLAFGLVHGFGFAGTLEGFGVRGWRLVAPTFGFNLGLELAQLAAAAVLLAPLWCLARTRSARLVIATGAAIVAFGWVVERAIGIADRVDPVITLAAGTPERLALALTIAAVLVWRRGRIPRVCRGHAPEIAANLTPASLPIGAEV